MKATNPLKGGQQVTARVTRFKCCAGVAGSNYSTISLNAGKSSRRPGVDVTKKRYILAPPFRVSQNTEYRLNAIFGSAATLQYVVKTFRRI